MSPEVIKLQARAEVLRIRMAAVRAAMPNPPAETALFLGLIYDLADDVLAGVELLADVTAETVRSPAASEPYSSYFLGRPPRAAFFSPPAPF